MDEPSLDEVDQAQYATLCTAVGHLFITFARLEGVLASMLKLHLAGDMGDMTDIAKVAKSSAIYGSLRFKAARDSIKRIATVEGAAEKTFSFVLSVFEQVAHIEDLRDKIAHHQLVPSTSGQPDRWVIHDATVTRDIRKPKVYVIHTNSIVLAAMDLNTAAARLGSGARPGHILIAAEDDLSSISWLYAPSMLKLIPQKSEGAA
jgi:hypothetical protein